VLGIAVAVIAAGTAVTMLTSSPALAGPLSVKDITTQVVTTTVTAAPGSDTATAEAFCPQGELLVGGGYVVNSTSTDWRIWVDAPLDDAAWVVEPTNFSTQPLSFSAYAICAMSVPGKNGISGYTTQTVQTAVNVPANQTGEADATCPAGELRTGGGYEVFNVSANWSIYLNSPLNNDTWTVEIDNEVTNATTITSYAQCLAKTNSQPIKALTVSTVEKSATVPANSVRTAHEHCGPQQVMTGGGHVIESIGQDWNIQASAPVSKNNWQVQVADLDNYSRVFDTIAVCLAKA
jgi:hypothetical protein